MYIIKKCVKVNFNIKYMNKFEYLKNMEIVVS